MDVGILAQEVSICDVLFSPLQQKSFFFSSSLDPRDFS